MTVTPIPVRQMHDDGYITVRYVNPDGSKFDDELPEHLVFGATPHPITALWDNEYQFGPQGRNMSQEIVPNLMHLSDVDPLLFERLLLALETGNRREAQIWFLRLKQSVMHSNGSTARGNYTPLYRAMMRAIPVASELAPNAAQGNELVSRAHKIVKGKNEDHLAAAAICYWVMDEATTAHPKISYGAHQKDIEFIDANLESVMSIRGALKQVKSFDRAFVAEMLGGSSALTDGAL